MPEIKHSELSEYLKTLKTLKPEAAPSVFFLWGDEYLCRIMFDTVINYLLTEKQKEIEYELLEGEDAVIPVIMERLSTYSIFQNKRVVAVKNAPLFIPPGSVAPAGFTAEDIEQLKVLVEKGFPENHYLIMTAPMANRQRLLFKTLKEAGVMINCTAPKGIRKADQAEKTELLRFTMKEILDRTGKGIEGYAFNTLTGMTGFDSATFADNLEKLVAFIGNRDTITAADVQSIVKRTKQDALFELNNAVSDRKPDHALFYFNSLGNSGFYPLQLLASLTNHFRKILMVKHFIISEKAKGNHCWQGGNRNYDQFMKNTMPWIVKADTEISETLFQWEESLASDNTAAPLAPGKAAIITDPRKAALAGPKKTVLAGPKKTTTDLTIAPNPKNGYPVFQTFIKSDHFSRDTLLSIFMELSELDYKLKTSSDSDPLILLEALIIKICIMDRK